MAPKRQSSEKALSGLVFAITGTLSVPRAKFEAFIEQHGGSVAKSVTNSCTHLVSAETGTKKCQDAEEKGVVVVDEDWVRSKVEGGVATAAPIAVAAPHAGVVDTGTNTGTKKALQDKSFHIHSSLEDKRAALEKLIRDNGGKVCADPSAENAVLVVSSLTAVMPEHRLLDMLYGAVPSTSAAAALPVASSASQATSSEAVETSSKASKPLQGMTICITGTLSVPRAEFERLVAKHGGKVAKTVSAACTHLVVASLEERETKKCRDAEAKGVAVVDEAFLRGLMDGEEGEGGSGDSVGREQGVAGGDFHPTKAFVPANQPFRADRATIHLFEAEGGDDDEEEPNISKADLKKLRPFLRRGDLLENVSLSGYRSSGVRIFDGREVTSLDTELDDYGCLGAEYVVYREFNPCYWDYGSMNVNNMLVPEVDEAASCWHSGEFPSCHIDRRAILEADGLTVEIFGKTYTIPQQFKDWVLEHADEDGPVDHEEVFYVDGMEDGASIVLI